MQNGDMLLLIGTEHRLFRTIVGVTVPFYNTFSNYDRHHTKCTNIVSTRTNALIFIGHYGHYCTVPVFWYSTHAHYLTQSIEHA